MKKLKNNARSIALVMIISTVSFNFSSNLYGMFPQSVQDFPGLEIPVTEVEDDVETQEEMQERIMKKKELEVNESHNGRIDKETLMVAGSN